MLTTWPRCAKQIKYSELPNFTEVMAAGTAAALVPIRSITRRVHADSAETLAAGSSPRVSVGDGHETVTYIADGQEDAGPVCLRLLTQLQAIQLGKVEDTFGWRVAVTEDDGSRVVGRATKDEEGANGQTVDQLD